MPTPGEYIRSPIYDWVDLRGDFAAYTSSDSSGSYVYYDSPIHGAMRAIANFVPYVDTDNPCEEGRKREYQTAKLAESIYSNLALLPRGLPREDNRNNKLKDMIFRHAREIIESAEIICG